MRLRKSHWHCSVGSSVWTVDLQWLCVVAICQCYNVCVIVDWFAVEGPTWLLPLLYMIYPMWQCYHTISLPTDNHDLNFQILERFCECVSYNIVLDDCQIGSILFPLTQLLSIFSRLKFRQHFCHSGKSDHLMNEENMRVSIAAVKDNNYNK